MEALPEGSQRGLPDLNHFRIRPTAYEPEPYGSGPSSRRVTFDGLPAPAADKELEARGARSLLRQQKAKPEAGPVTYWCEASFACAVL